MACMVVPSSTLNITGSGSLTTVGGGASVGRFGISSKTVVISGGTVTAMGGKAGSYSFGVTGCTTVNDSDGAANNGLLIAKGETVAATITANWTAISSSGDGSDDSSGSTATVPISSGTNQISASTSVSGGTAALEVTSSMGAVTFDKTALDSVAGKGDVEALRGDRR